MRLVVFIAKHYQGRELPFIDLIQEGLIGLHIAAGKFDPKLGNRFSTMAYAWIQQAIQQAIYKQGRTIRLPIRVYEAYRTAMGRQASVEAGDHPLLTEEVLTRIQQTQVLSIEALAESCLETDDGDFDLADEQPSIEEILIAEESRQDIDTVLATLPDPRLAYILTRYYDLDEQGEATYQSIGEVLGVSRERVRQLLNMALAALQKADLLT
jgi:RNA polymerase sigma factor (sigma-70 family)